MQTASAFQIHQGRSAADVSAEVGLFAAYAASLDVDLAYQDFGAEMASLPCAHAPPSGALLLACDATNQPVGSVGLRPSGSDANGEMKRLYVAPEGRGMGIGAALVLNFKSKFC